MNYWQVLLPKNDINSFKWLWIIEKLHRLALWEVIVTIKDGDYVTIQ